MGTEPAESNRALWFILLAVIVGGFALAGYAGYALYPRFDLPAATGLGLLVLAAAAGVASFFSPCSFPLLVTLLARQTSGHRSEDTPQANQAIRFGAALAVGASLFLILVGIAIAFGGAALFSGVTFTSTAGIIIRAVVGVLLILLGLIQLGLTPFSFRAADKLALPLMQRQATLRHEQPILGYVLLGFGYILAGFG